jgi:hypothetical protein
MVKNTKKLKEFYHRKIVTEKLTYKQALVIYEALWKEAVGLGIISSKNIWEGIDTYIRMTRLIHKLPNV